MAPELATKKIKLSCNQMGDSFVHHYDYLVRRPSALDEIPGYNNKDDTRLPISLKTSLKLTALSKEPMDTRKVALVGTNGHNVYRSQNGKPGKLAEQYSYDLIGRGNLIGHTLYNDRGIMTQRTVLCPNNVCMKHKFNGNQVQVTFQQNFGAKEICDSYGVKSLNFSYDSNNNFSLVSGIDSQDKPLVEARLKFFNSAILNIEDIKKNQKTAEQYQGAKPIILPLQETLKRYKDSMNTTKQRKVKTAADAAPVAA